MMRFFRFIAVLLLIAAVSAGCARRGFSSTQWNPFGLKQLFGSELQTIRIAITASSEGVFDTADWAFIKHRTPWEPLARALSADLGMRVEFQQLEAFQIAHHLNTGRCQFALVSEDAYASIVESGTSVRVLARPEVLTRQGVLVAKADSDIHELSDLAGRRFAFGPRHDAILFFRTLKVLDEAGISPSDLKQEIALTGFEGTLQNHASSRDAAWEIAYGRGTRAGVIEAFEFDAYPETGGAWTPLAYRFSKDQFRVLARTELVTAVTLENARFVAGSWIPAELADQVAGVLTKLHDKKPDAMAALGYRRFRLMDAQTGSTPTDEPTQAAPDAMDSRDTEQSQDQEPKE